MYLNSHDCTTPGVYHSVDCTIRTAAYLSLVQQIICCKVKCLQQKLTTSRCPSYHKYLIMPLLRLRINFYLFSHATILEKQISCLWYYNNIKYNMAKKFRIFKLTISGEICSFPTLSILLERSRSL